MMGHNPQGSSSTWLWVIVSRNFLFPCVYTGWDSSVGTMAGYGMDGPGIASRWGRIFSARWLRRCATNRKVTGSIPDGVIGIFHWHIPSDRTLALGSTQPLTEMSTRSISWG